MHHEGRHQVLEHRTRPGQKRGVQPDGAERTRQVKPMQRGNVALGDRHEARQARLGGQKIVIPGIHFLLGHLVADRKDLLHRDRKETRTASPGRAGGTRATKAPGAAGGRRERFSGLKITRVASHLMQEKLRPALALGRRIPLSAKALAISTSVTAFSSRTDNASCAARLCRRSWMAASSCRPVTDSVRRLSRWLAAASVMRTRTSSAPVKISARRKASDASRRQALPSVHRWPARFPLSTVET